MPFKFLAASLLLVSFSCDNNVASVNGQNTGRKGLPALPPDDNPYGHIIDIPLPAGFKRVSTDPFGLYLRQLPLKKDKTVHLYDGLLKLNQSAQFAVLDVSVGNKDLQQCADAVMRLRAEYLFAAKQFVQINFIDNNRKPYQFTQPYTRENLAKYMQKVFAFCGSASLSKQLKKAASFGEIQPGDVIIHGGFPGHAVLVIDVAMNEAGEKIFLLAQSYMPAQDIHVLVNPNDAKLSPWYRIPTGKELKTPEWDFTTEELKRW
jgi:hypothetical protein